MKIGVAIVNAVCYTPNLILGMVDLAKVGLEVITDSRYTKGFNAGYIEGYKNGKS